MEYNIQNLNFATLNDFDRDCDTDLNLNIFSLNSRSIQSLDKFNTLINIITSLTIDIQIIVIQETWIKNEIKSIYNIDGFCSYHSCRSDGYGGVSIFVHESLKNVFVDIDAVNNINVIEMK